MPSNLPSPTPPLTMAYKPARALPDPKHPLKGEERRGPPAGSIVALRAEGDRAPVYFVHGVGGGMLWGYENLIRHLGPGHPFYAFSSRGLLGLPEPATIEELAASYVADLCAHRPAGPYLLGGYCFGGVVAYEMARQLEAQGRSVALLALINSPPPNTNYEHPRERGTLRWRLRCALNLAGWGASFLFTWTLAEQSEFARWKLRVVRKKLTTPKPRTATDAAVTDINELLGMTGTYSARDRALWETHVRALRGYQPRPYGGEVVLFRTRGHPLLTSFDHHYGWGELARGGVTTHVMPGAHANILKVPHVRAVARVFDRCAAAADNQQASA